MIVLRHQSVVSHQCSDDEIVIKEHAGFGFGFDDEAEDDTDNGEDGEYCAHGDDRS